MVSTDSLKQRAHERLLKKLASGRMRPGTRISESQLAKELGSSRGPVREAVSQLASQGILDQIPGVGAFVKAVSPREMEDLYEFREALECHAAFLAATRINPNQLMAIQSTLVETRSVLVEMYDAGHHELDKADTARWVQIDAKFHGLILEAAGSTWLQRHGTDSQFLRRIWCQRLDPTLFDIRRVLTNSYRDHTRIVRALQRGNADEARRWMLSHIQTTKQRFVSQITTQTEAARPWSTGATANSPAPPQRIQRRRTKIERHD